MSKYISKISLTIAIIILFVPTIIGFLYINSKDGEKTPNLPDDANYKISITDGTDTQALGESATALVISDVNLSDAVVDTSTVDRRDELKYEMKIVTERGSVIESEKTYVCYITSDIERCYFVKDDLICKFSSSTASELLKLSVCQRAITYVKAPLAIYLNGEEEVELEYTDMLWKYVNVRGDTVSNDDVNASASQITINYSKGSVFQSKFDFGKITDISGNEQVPKEVYVTLENEETKYDRMLIGQLDTFIESKALKSDTKFTATMEVIWGSDDMSFGFSGKHTYKFNVIYDVPAVFEVSDKAVYPSALVLIKAENLGYGATVTSTVTNEAGEILDIKLDFVEYNGKHIAFMPLDFTAKPGKYKILLSDGNVESEYALTIRERNYETRSITLPAKLMSENYGESKKVSFTLTMEDVYANVVNEKLWSGKFTAPLKVKLEKYISYGDHITLNVENNERAYCNVYTAPADTAVVAVNKGRVVYAGETSITGKLVVIEHGFGLKSWYWNLGSVDVKVGDDIEKGKQIGKVGNSGLCDETQTVLSFAMSVGDVYFKPELYFNRTLIYFDR